jgi:hypothetical protein
MMEKMDTFISDRLTKKANEMDLELNFSAVMLSFKGIMRRDLGKE